MINFYYFSAKWCGPCKSMQPVVAELALKHGIQVQYVDCEVEEDLAAKYNIRAVPTLLQSLNGKEVKRIAGNTPRERIEQFLTGTIEASF